MARFVFARFGPPYVVKPPSDGASRFVWPRASLNCLMPSERADAYGAALVEEYIRGQETTVGVIEDFRDEELYTLPESHVTLPEGARFMDLQHHELGSLRHMVPSNFSRKEKKALADVARVAHRALGLSHFSRADIILTPRAPYLLEVNSVPGLYQGAALPHMLESVGSSVKEFLEHAIALARR